MTANSAWESLLRAHVALIKRFTAEDVWGDLSMREYDVLYTLSKCDGPVRFGELNKQVLLSQPAMSRLVDRLTAQGLIHREPDPADRRGLHLTLTGKGREVQREIGTRHARGVARAMSDALTPDELRQLEALCAKLSRRAGESG